MDYFHPYLMEKLFHCFTTHISIVIFFMPHYMIKLVHASIGTVIIRCRKPQNPVFFQHRGNFFST